MTLGDVFSVISNLTTKTSVVNADIIPIADSAASPTAFNSAKITIANFVASLKTLIATDTLAAPTDITTNNSSTSFHGFLKKLSGATSDVMRGDGTWGGIYAPEGFLQNGKIVPSVSSNNLTVAIKTLAGTDPSSTDVVYVRINNVVRSITSALSVTLNAGTNYFGLGSTAFATQEADLFCYLGYNTGVSAVVIGFARTGGGAQYSDFSATNTAEKYLAISNATSIASTDYFVNIGRFAAILSATASFNWSVPTFTAINLLNYPIRESRWLTYAPVITAATGSLTTVSSA